jgi:hypothetical protein
LIIIGSLGRVWGFTYKGCQCSQGEDGKLVITIPYRDLDHAPGRLPAGKYEQEEQHPRVETLMEKGSDIRREKGTEKPLFQVKVKFKCSTLGKAHFFSVFKGLNTFSVHVETLGHMWEKRL